MNPVMLSQVCILSMVLSIRTNIKYHKFKVGDRVRILKYKNIGLRKSFWSKQ